MSKIIAVINQKGGVGKTAIACHLAYCLAKKNKSTLLIDIDPSANATSFFTNHQHFFTTRDLLLRQALSIDLIQLTYQKQKRVDFLKLVPAHINLAMAEIDLASRPFKESILEKRLKTDIEFTPYDYILIDCPPTLSTLTINAMYAADFILVPINYQKHALEGIADLFELLDEIKENQTYDVRILRNQYDARKKVVNEYVLEQLAHLEAITLETIIRQDEAVNRATLQGLTVFEHCPHTTAAPDYQQLTNELEELFNAPKQAK